MENPSEDTEPNWATPFSTVWIGQALSLAVAGPLSDAVGSNTWFVFSGIACVAMGVAGFSIPAVMNLEQDRSASAQAEREPTTGPQAK